MKRSSYRPVLISIWLAALLCSSCRSGRYFNYVHCTKVEILPGMDGSPRYDSYKLQLVGKDSLPTRDIKGAKVDGLLFQDLTFIQSGDTISVVFSALEHMKESMQPPDGHLGKKASVLLVGSDEKTITLRLGKITRLPTVINP